MQFSPGSIFPFPQDIFPSSIHISFKSSGQLVQSSHGSIFPFPQFGFFGLIREQQI